MYKEITGNQTKTVFLLVLFVALVVVFGWFLSEYFGEPLLLPIAGVVAFVQAFISYYYSDKVALAASGAVPVPENGDGLIIHRAVENAAITAGLPKPRVYFIDDTAPNAFATGRDPQHAAVAVTRGLVEKLNKRELEGVLAHEMSHVGNYDIRVMSIVVVLASDWLLRMMWYGGRDSDNRSGAGIFGLIGLVLAILSPLFATLMQLAISRKREFLADATGALITRDPEGLASALRKIAADREPLEVANKATAHLYIANPFKDVDGRSGDKRSWFAGLFDTHPPVAERIKRLENMVR